MTRTFVQTATLILAGGLVAAAALAAAPARLALWITTPVGATNGQQCDLTESFSRHENLPNSPPAVTERDVFAWTAGNAYWSLNPEQFADRDAARKLENHCFILAIDGKVISSGIVLPAHSARSVHFPTLQVIRSARGLDLLLTSGHHGNSARPIHVGALNAVLESRGDLKR